MGLKTASNKSTMTGHHMTITVENVTDHTLRLAPPAAVAVANELSADVPTLINSIMLGYVSVLLVHKLWSVFKEWREGRLKINIPAADGDKQDETGGAWK
jgi:hypothetical protein